MGTRRFPLFSAVLLAACVARGQTVPKPQAGPRDYRGVQTHIDGLFITPVPNAPFSADVQIVSHKVMPDGTELVVTTVNHVARSSSGRIYNESRQMRSTEAKGEPRLLSAHIYDPNTRQNIYYNPVLHLARQTILPAPPAVPPALRAPEAQPKLPGVVETPLGMQALDGVQLTGSRRERTIPAEASGTGKALTVTDDYWYSPELSIYMTISHKDPRSGEQLVAVTKVDRHEPAADRFTVPADYKVVDETPPVVPRGVGVDRVEEKNNPFPQ